MSDDLPTGAMRFVSAFQPGLKDGRYELTVAQKVSAGSVEPRTQRFMVSGPRFAIDPSDIHAQFPPPGHSGQFTEVLPHIVLTKRLLPWEREVPHLTAETPWLALLVFEDGELDPSASADQSETVTVAQLLSASAAAAPSVRKPRIDPKSLSSDERAMSCRAITMDGSTFARLVPAALELPFLAHARRVDTGDKVALPLKDEGLFSVIVANRFPEPGDSVRGAKAVVHLVSLEGFGDLLNHAAPQAPAEPKLQMVTLASWTFSCLPDAAQTFSGLAQALAYDPSGTPKPADSLRLRVGLPVGPASGSVGDRLADGYCALGYHAITGEDGFAWYRGPLTPVVTTALGAGPFQTASAATIYDCASGVFDHSLSAAWRAGHALALADRSFATSLIAIRGRANALLDRLAADSTSSLGANVHAAAAAAVALAVQPLGDVSSAGAVAAAAPRSAPAPTVSSHAAALRALIAGTAAPALAAAVAQDPDAPAAAAWLARLQLLVGVPFLHLVPDGRALPPESVRFGFVDANWTSALLDGALAIGLGSSRDVAVQQAVSADLKAMAAAAAQAERAASLGQPIPAVPAGPCGAMLIRSALVSGWPGLTVAAFVSRIPVALLRTERLAPDVLLCIFNGVPDTVTLTKPHEGLEFGVDDEGQLTLRTVSAGKVVAGTDIKIYDPHTGAAAQPSLRPGGSRVLNVRLPAAAGDPVDLVGMLAKGLAIDVGALDPATFALQMVKGPEQLIFNPSPPARPVPGARP